jgi:hypothetical protein
LKVKCKIWDLQPDLNGALYLLPFGARNKSGSGRRNSCPKKN